MVKKLFIPVLLSLTLLSGLFSCKQTDKKNKNDLTKQKDTRVTPPYENQPAIENSSDTECWFNPGLTYDVTVELDYKTSTNFTGHVKSENLQTNEIEIAQFTGTESENKLTIIFKDKPPVVGAATEWTDKKWYFEKAVAKNSTSPTQLVIPVQAKNYQTNKWEDGAMLLYKQDCK